MKAPKMKFPHRRNQDETRDSICRACLATVATIQNEEGLRAHERTHICDPLWAYRAGEGYGLRAASH
jgi:hypothetical protein